MEIKIPSTCPTCNSPLERRNDQLFCTNSLCEAKSSKKLTHFAKTMKIMGLGEKTIEKLEIGNISELYSLDQFYIIDKLGEKIGNKVYDEIEKSKVTSIGKFLTAMAIPLIGKVAAEKVAKNVSSIKEINENICKKSGLGPKATENLLYWIENEYDSTWPIKFSETVELKTSKVVCISGKIKGYTKEQIKQLLLDYNVGVVENVTKNVNYLITEEANTSKVAKANEYNIPIMNLSEFMNILENE